MPRNGVTSGKALAMEAVLTAGLVGSIATEGKLGVDKPTELNEWLKITRGHELCKRAV
jgi:hypothetical protein